MATVSATQSKKNHIQKLHVDKYGLRLVSVTISKLQGKVCENVGNNFLVVAFIGLKHRFKLNLEC